MQQHFVVVFRSRIFVFCIHVEDSKASLQQFPLVVSGVRPLTQILAWGVYSCRRSAWGSALLSSLLLCRVCSVGAARIFGMLIFAGQRTGEWCAILLVCQL